MNEQQNTANVNNLCHSTPLPTYEEAVNKNNNGSSARIDVENLQTTSIEQLSSQINANYNRELAASRPDAGTNNEALRDRVAQYIAEYAVANALAEDYNRHILQQERKRKITLIFISILIIAGIIILYSRIQRLNAYYARIDATNRNKIESYSPRPMLNISLPL